MTEMPVSVYFDHCVRVYLAMEQEAVTDDDGQVVYSGFLTALFSRLGYSTPYYSRLTKLLREMGCIYQLTRGGGSAQRPSRWILLKRPTTAAFLAASEPKEGQELALSPRQLTQMVRDLSERVDKLEGAR